MSNYTRKLRRIKERKQAREESKLWTAEDWGYFRKVRFELLQSKVKREAASRRAYAATRKMILNEQQG